MTGDSEDPNDDEQYHLGVRPADLAESVLLPGNPERIDTIADISARSMQSVFEAGQFFTRYRRFFRFSEDEMEERRDGILFDQLPRALRPLRRFVFSDGATRLMNRLNVPSTLAEANRELVGGAPLVLAALLDRTEYRPGELSGFYSVFGLGAAMENLWLTTTALGMGIQFISFPMEVPEQWRRIEDLLEVPDDLELMALYRIGYELPDAPRPPIDWSSRQRKRRSQYVFRNSCAQPEPDSADGAAADASADVAGNRSTEEVGG